MTDDQATAAIDAAAAVLGLKVPADLRAGVLASWCFARDFAALLDTLPLTPADESGSVFRPVEPESGP